MNARTPDSASTITPVTMPQSVLILVALTTLATATKAPHARAKAIILARILGQNFPVEKIYLEGIEGITKPMVQVAAAGVGLDRTRFAVHSLRIGGACALLHAGFSIEIIQRWGRWASNAFQAYLWESSDDARDVAAKMVASRGSLTVTRQL